METALAHESVHVQEGAAAAEPSVSGQRLTSRKSNGASLKEAVQMKTEGNAFYKEKNLRSAIRRYHSALLVLRGLDSDLMSSLKGFGPETPPLTPEQETLLRNIQVDCYNNLAGTNCNYNTGVLFIKILSTKSTASYVNLLVVFLKGQRAKFKF